MQQHEIKIHLIKGVGVRPGALDPLRVGDQVRYTSPDGKVRIAFDDGTPYEVDGVGDSEAHTLKTPGKFVFKCFLTPTGSTEEIGWTPEHPEAGGEHDVHPA